MYLVMVSFQQCPHPPTLEVLATLAASSFSTRLLAQVRFQALVAILTGQSFRLTEDHTVSVIHRVVDSSSVRLEPITYERQWAREVGWNFSRG